MLIEDSVAYNHGGLYVGRHYRYASVGGHTEIPSEVIREIKRTYSEGSKDPLKRFEYLRNGKATSVMIRATPNAVRWDEINRIQYRFQALNFHSDVLEALIHNSPPLSRREHKIASKSTNNSDDKNKEVTNDSNNNTIDHRSERQQDSQNGSSCSNDFDHTDQNADSDTYAACKKDKQTQRLVTCLHRSNSFESVKRDMDDNYSKRKGSVIQLTKDDTSDYNSDEEVFPNRSESDSFDSVNYNATICHVNTGHIRDTARIHVTSYNEESDTEDSGTVASSHSSKELDNTNTLNVGNNNDHNKNNRNETDLSRLAIRETYTNRGGEGADCIRNVSSAPPSTKVSVVTPMDQLSINDRYQSENLHMDIDIDGEDLNLKTKEELVELVRRLKSELETTKHYSLQRNHDLPSARYRSRSAAQSTCGGSGGNVGGEETQRRSSNHQDSIDEEDSTVDEQAPSVLRLIKNFEQKTDDCADA